MRRNYILIFIFLFSFIFFSYSETYICDDCTIVIPEVDGTEYYDDVTIDYSNGDLFHGSVNVIDSYDDSSSTCVLTYGQMIYSDGSIYIGDFESDKKNGYGEYEDDKITYSGYWKDNIQDGDGSLYLKTEKSKYVGCFVCGKRSGQGIITYDDNDNYYEGEWKEDLPNGFGIKYENGRSYEGNWIDGKFVGNGKKIDSEGNIIEGCFLNQDTVSGEEVDFVSKEGNEYHGEVKENSFEGTGIYVDADGTSYLGSFVENQKNGLGQVVYHSQTNEDEIGNIYSGYYYANQRNGNGNFKFSNGYEYTGGFLNGQFYRTGYLEAKENDEFVVIASDEWDSDCDLESGRIQSTSGDAQDFSCIDIAPKRGKIAFSNGDLYEGLLEYGQPVQYCGIWTTREERLARLQKGNNYAIPVTYTTQNCVYDLSSVYSPDEVYALLHDVGFFKKFDDFYQKHKKTIDMITGGLQFVSTVLAVIPSPIQPIAAAVDIGLSVTKLGVNAVHSSIEVYDAYKSGNPEAIPGLIADFGKEAAWDAVNIFCGCPAGGKIVRKISGKAIEGLGKVGEKISGQIIKTCDKIPALKMAKTKLDSLGRVGKGFAKSIENSGFYRYIADNGGKVTQSLSDKWIEKCYPDLFSKYGHKATEMLFKHGDEVAKVLKNNGDLVFSVGSKNVDKVAIMIKNNGDKFVSKIMASDNPIEMATLLTKSKNPKQILNLLSKNSELTSKINKLSSTVSEQAMMSIDRFGSKAVNALERNADDFLAQLSKRNVQQHRKIVDVFANPEAYNIYAKNGEKYLDLVENISKSQQKKLIDSINNQGIDYLAEAIRMATPSEKKKILEICSKEHNLLGKNISPNEIRNIELLSTRNGNLIGKKHPKTGVPFEQKTVSIMNGNTKSGVFPKFDADFEANLPKDLLMASDKQQFRECNRQLSKSIEKNSNLRKHFTEEQLDQIFNGETPDGYTWHHNEEEGIMQLVDSIIHKDTAHTGGKSIWGGGKEFR